MVRWNHRHCSPLFAFYSLLSIFSRGVLGDEQGFDCHVTVDGAQFDLTKLAGEHTLNRTRDTPPTQMIDSLRFNLCADLTSKEGIPDQDQCPAGTRACLTVVNKKKDEPDRITSVIQLALTSAPAATTASTSDPKFVTLLFRGHDYPHPANPTPVSQAINFTIQCDPDSTSDPKFVSYDGSILNIEWSAPAGCATDQGSEPPKDDKGGDNNDDNPGEQENVGSGVGWFFLVVLLAFAAYFGLGAYYNYTTYGARGMDLIPHRDFWREVPYMLKDVVSHLCSSVNRRSSRGGYVAV